MPRRHERHRDACADIYGLVPVVGLGRDGGIVIAHDGVVAERRDHARAVRGDKPRQGADVEMVVVSVRHQDRVDRRQIGKGDARIIDPLGADKAERRCALRPHRVDQNVEAGRLDEPARVPDIGQAPGRAFDAVGRTISIRRRRPCRPFRLGAAPVTIDQPTQQIALVPRRHAAAIVKTLAVEVIGDRTVIVTRRHCSPLYSLRGGADRANNAAVDESGV